MFSENVPPADVESRAQKSVDRLKYLASVVSSKEDTEIGAGIVGNYTRFLISDANVGFIVWHMTPG